MMQSTSDGMYSCLEYKHYTLLVSNRSFPIEGKCHNHSNQGSSCCYSCIYKPPSNKKVPLLSFNCFKKRMKMNCIVVRQQVKWKCMTEWSSLWQKNSFSFFTFLLNNIILRRQQTAIEVLNVVLENYYIPNIQCLIHFQWLNKMSVLYNNAS